MIGFNCSALSGYHTHNKDQNKENNDAKDPDENGI